MSKQIGCKNKSGRYKEVRPVIALRLDGDLYRKFEKVVEDSDSNFSKIVNKVLTERIIIDDLLTLENDK